MRALPLTLVLLTSMLGMAEGYAAPKSAGVKLAICGDMDDNAPANASGNCLKVRAIYNGDTNEKKWFTSTPSLTVMNALGYVKQDSADNTGDSYADLTRERGFSVPFAEFRQDGKEMISTSSEEGGEYGVNGQFDRWCQKLAHLNFAGKANWRRPTENELYEMLSYGYTNDANMYRRFGWPVRVYYWSSSFSTFGSLPADIKAVPLDGYEAITYTAAYSAYASCVAVEQ